MHCILFCALDPKVQPFDHPTPCPLEVMASHPLTGAAVCCLMVLTLLSLLFPVWQDAVQGQVIYRKGSGIASLAKFMANAQQLHLPTRAAEAGDQSAVAAQQAPTTADGSRPSSAAK